MPTWELIITGLPPGRTVVGGASRVVSFRPPVGRRSIAVRTQFWPPTLPTPWGGGPSGNLTLSLLDLLRCTTRYFFIESWLAGRADGWVLGLPVVEYLADGPELRWRRRNANVARWLSEMAGVGLSCYVMELCGATNIALGNGGLSGPDYCCHLTINGQATKVWFESKGSSTRAGVTAQVQRAADQVAPYKGSGTLGLICAACVPSIGSPDQPCIYLADPPTDGESDVSSFQLNIAALAATLGWAGRPDVAHELASAVMSFEDGGPMYRSPQAALAEVERRCQPLARSLAQIAEEGAENTVLSGPEGSLTARLPVENLRTLAHLCREGPDRVSRFQITPVQRGDAGQLDQTSFAPDGSALIWRPNEQRKRR
jgi:hypothetical protein